MRSSIIQFQQLGLSQCDKSRHQSHNMQSSASCGANAYNSKKVELDPFKGLLSCFLPEEVLIHLFSFVDPHSLVFRYSLVCRRWRDIITDSRVWKLKILQRSNLHATLSKYSENELKNLTVNYPWFLFYWILKNDVPFERNLLRNNSGQRGLKHWEWIVPGKQLEIGCWNIEAQLVGADSLPESDDFENIQCCFSTSYPPCSKEQFINLSENGFPNKLLDEFQPPITISEWYAGRYDYHHSYYWLSISLLDKDRGEIAGVPTIRRTGLLCQGEMIRIPATFRVKLLGRNQEWTKVTIAIKKYGKGVRYIRFEHGGTNEIQYTSGNCGSRMAGGVVRISLPEVKGMDDEISSEKPVITIF